MPELVPARHLPITPRDGPGIRPEPREVLRVFFLRPSSDRIGLFQVVATINLFHVSYRFIGRCRSPQGGGTGPGRVRTGRACCAVEVVRPSRGLEEDATGPPAEART